MRLNMRSIQFGFLILLFFGLPAGCSLNAQIVNGYAAVEGISGQVLSLGAQNETHGSFTVGQQLLIMQMQDNVIGNTTNSAAFGSVGSISSAGQYEIREIESITRTEGLATSITLNAAPITTFNTGEHARLQVVTFPQLGTPHYATSANITALSWNGDYGGVVAFQVEKTLTLSHAIHADGAGFRGGTRSNNHGPPLDCDNTVFRSNSANNGEKGEGIYRNTNDDWRYARGPLVSGGGGGGGHNGGGGGGGNLSAGGIGGAGYDNTAEGCEESISGIGGVTLNSFIEANRFFMGGGGGGGQQNNANSTNGARGGGIVFIKAQRLVTPATTCSARISANGANAALAGNDGAGGGGAAGSIVLQIPLFEVQTDCPLTIEANGGNGGSVNSSTHAAGGGGGQGALFFSGPQPTSHVTTTTLNGAGGCDNTACTQGGQPGAGLDNMGIFSGMPSLLSSAHIALQAEPHFNAIQLTWKLTAETPLSNLRQRLQRSLDLARWETIYETSAQAGMHASPEHFTDHPRKGTWYYRVQAEPYDITSNVVAASLKGLQPAMRLHPNPAQNAVTLTFDEAMSGRVQLYNQQGQLIIEQPCHDSRELQVSLQTLASGIYTVAFSNAEISERQKLIVH